MHLLAVNCGSSSIKVRVFDSDQDFRLLVKGVAERIGQESASLALTTENHREFRKTLPLPDHRAALRALHQTLVEGDPDFVGTVRPIGGVGHRIVHGGERFRAPVLITAEVIAGIAEAARFAPLHCRPNLIGIEVAQELLPDIPHVAVFDTAAHQSLPPKAFLYGLPAELYARYKVRRYGFHGINHSYVAQVAAQMMAQPLAGLKVITCHLGNGCSITAWAQGQSVDTSMGLTPLEGLLMGTRCGDLDPAIVLYLMEELGLPPAEVTDLLNNKSGLLGLCGTNDMRDVLALAQAGNLPAQVAREMFVYRIVKYIGAYAAVLNGIDLVVFTGGIGEKDPEVRERVTANLAYLGAHLDRQKNERNAPVFSSEASRVTLLTIPANEERVIAQHTYELLTHGEEPSLQQTATESSGT